VCLFFGVLCRLLITEQFLVIFHPAHIPLFPSFHAMGYESVLLLLSLLLIVGSLTTLALGIVALNDIRRRKLAGKGQAIFAIIMGTFCVLVWIHISMSVSARKQERIDWQIDHFLAERGIDNLTENDLTKSYDAKGNTLLHIAVMEDVEGFFAWDVAVAKYLVSRGVDVNTKNDDGKTPLDLAKDVGNTEMTQYLSSVSGTSIAIGQAARSTTPQPAIPAADQNRAKKAMDDIIVSCRVEEKKIDDQTSLSNISPQTKHKDAIKEAWRKIEFGLDNTLSECPQGFQLAFEKYKEAFTDYKDAALACCDTHWEEELGRTSSAFGNNRPLNDARQLEKDASRAFDRARERLNNARERLEKEVR
jgi:hypothetical protein